MVVRYVDIVGHFFESTPVFEWCVVGCGSKNKHPKDTCYKRGLYLQYQFTTLHSLVAAQWKWPMYSFKVSTHMHFR